MSEYLRLLGYIKKYKRRFFWGLLFSLTASLANAVSLSALMPIFQTMMDNNTQQHFYLPLTPEDVRLLKESGQETRLNRMLQKLPEDQTYLTEQKSGITFLPHGLETQAALWKLRINEFSGRFGKLELLMIICGIILPIYLIKLMSILGTVYFINSTGLLAVRDIRKELYSKLIELPLGRFVKEKTGVLMSRIMNDVIIISESLSQKLRVSIVNLLIIGTHFILLTILDSKLVLVCIVGVPLALWPVNHFSRKIRRITSGEQAYMADLNGHLQEIISGIRVVRAFGMESYNAQKFQKLNNSMYDQTFRYHLNHTFGPSLVEFVTSFIVVLLLLYGASRIISSEMSPGSFFTFLFTLIVILSPIKQIATWINEIRRTSAAGERIFEIIDAETEASRSKGIVYSERLKDNIAFKNVYFKYPETKVNVLKKINLEIPIGTTLAIVGHSGAGKSTLVDLVPRFYELDKGSISFDGMNIQNINLKSLRGKIGIVTQEIFLFNGTIKENICFGRENVDEKEILRVSQESYSDEFIKKLPEKYNTSIGERGMLLSGGQRQRISIARALLKNPEILILDEATSSLDTRSEKLVQKALARLMKDRTTFVIAHRLSTIYNADRILVLDRGQIIEMGSHSSLLKQKGLYYELYNMQFKT